MKIALCSSGATLDSPMDPGLGGCRYFVLVDTDTLDTAAEPNLSAQADRGAGVVAAQHLATKGVQAVLTGNIGPNAFRVLDAAGIAVYTCAAQTVRDAVEQFKSGELTQINAATAGPHFGTTVTGLGRGISLSGGRGRRRGLRRGGGCRGAGSSGG